MCAPRNSHWASARSWVSRLRCYAAGLRQVFVRPTLAVSFLIPSHLTWEERLTLFKLGLRGGVIAEIGSYVGASACSFAAALQNSNGKVLCIDTWNNDAMTEGGRDTWEAFQINTRRYAKYIIPIRGYSTKVVQLVREITPSLDILFIDGDHTYPGVKSDWEAYKTFLKPGAIVIFHDIGWAEGVMRVVHEDVEPYVSSSHRLPNMWWGTIGRAT